MCPAHVTGVSIKLPALSFTSETDLEAHMRTRRCLHVFEQRNRESREVPLYKGARLAFLCMRNVACVGLHNREAICSAAASTHALHRGKRGMFTTPVRKWNHAHSQACYSHDTGPTHPLGGLFSSRQILHYYFLSGGVVLWCATHWLERETLPWAPAPARSSRVRQPALMLRNSRRQGGFQ